MPTPESSTPQTLDPDRLRRVELLVLDVDGVLTDGSIIVDDHGVESKRFHVRDGAAIALWHKSGKRTAILSGRAARCVDRRAAELKIAPVVQGSSDKGRDLSVILRDLGLQPDQVGFMGDDLADLPALGLAGFAACPADAAAEVRRAVDLITDAPGGRGAVREVIERLMRAQGTWPLVPPDRAATA